MRIIRLIKESINSIKRLSYTKKYMILALSFYALQLILYPISGIIQHYVLYFWPTANGLEESGLLFTGITSLIWALVSSKLVGIIRSLTLSLLLLLFLLVLEWFVLCRIFNLAGGDPEGWGFIIIIGFLITYSLAQIVISCISLMFTKNLYNNELLKYIEKAIIKFDKIITRRDTTVN